MKIETQEAIQLFRSLTALRLGLMVFSLLMNKLLFDRFFILDGLHALEVLFLFVYLSLPILQQQFKGAYFPIALGLATTLPLLVEYVVPHIYNTNANFTPIFLFMNRDQSFPIRAIEAWLTFGLMQLQVAGFITLVFVSWAYELKIVIIYCVAITLMEYWLINVLGTVEPIEGSLQLGRIGTQAAMFFVVGYLVARLIAIQRRQQQALTEANIRLQTFATTLEQLTISRERNQMARELHDTLAHTLSAVSIKLEAANVIWQSKPQEAHTMLQDVQASIRLGLTDTRRALQSLRASPLEDLGLVLALRMLATTNAQQTGIKMNLDFPDQLDGLSPQVEHAIYRIVQEAFANITRHADARQVWLYLQAEKNNLILSIRDDGIGFEINQVSQAHHFGLAGMRERAAMIGAHLTIDSQPKHGTIIQLFMENAYAARLNL